MYYLPQTGKFAHDDLVKHVATGGCFPAKIHAWSFIQNKSKSIEFILIAEDFSFTHEPCKIFSGIHKIGLYQKNMWAFNPRLNFQSSHTIQQWLTNKISTLILPLESSQVWDAHLICDNPTVAILMQAHPFWIKAAQRNPRQLPFLCNSSRYPMTTIIKYCCYCLLLYSVALFINCESFRQLYPPHLKLSRMGYT